MKKGGLEVERPVQPTELVISDRKNEIESEDSYPIKVGYSDLL